VLEARERWHDGIDLLCPPDGSEESHIKSHYYRSKAIAHLSIVAARATDAREIIGM